MVDICAFSLNSVQGSKSSTVEVEPSLPQAIGTIRSIYSAKGSGTLKRAYRGLKKYAERRKYTVLPGRSNECKLSVKLITIKTNQKMYKKVFALAHEIGHAIRDPKSIQELGTASYFAHGQWMEFEYEQRAWEFADKLAKRYEVYTKEYLQYKHACLKSYYAYYK